MNQLHSWVTHPSMQGALLLWSHLILLTLSHTCGRYDCRTLNTSPSSVVPSNTTTISAPHACSSCQVQVYDAME
jgi:hypothetical protein